MAATNTSASATNRLGIRYVTKGPAGLRRRFNELIRALDYLFPGQSADIISEVTPQGTLYRLRVPQISSRERTDIRFQIIPVGGAAKVTIGNPGDVENIIPTIDGTLINTSPSPELTVITGSVYLECTMDAAGALTAAEIKNAASLPANTSTLRYRQLGTVSVSGTTVTVTAQTVTTSVSHKLCAGLSTWGQA